MHISIFSFLFFFFVVKEKIFAVLNSSVEDQGLSIQKPSFQIIDKSLSTTLSTNKIPIYPKGSTNLCLSSSSTASASPPLNSLRLQAAEEEKNRRKKLFYLF